MLLMAVVLIGFSCNKNEDPIALPIDEQIAIDLDIIKSYLEDNNIINALNDCITGDVNESPNCNGDVSYVLHEEGSGLVPPNNSTTKMVVSYKGRLLDTGEEFDAGDSVEFSLGGLIVGWQLLLIEMQEGDSVTMYIPSSYGYGFNGLSPDIPSNANLIFDMKLHQVN